MQGRQLYYYHNATKIATTVFGSLFSNIYVAKDGELVAVPLNYAGIPKHLVQNTNEDERNIVDRQLPAISFNLSSFTYDSVKKLGNNSTIKICCEDPLSGNTETHVTGHAAPWIVGFQVRIKSKTLDEGFQIIEQIIPYFTPTLTVDVKDFADLLGDCKYSRSDITMVGFDHSNEYEGSFEDKRELEWTLDFTMTVPYWGFISGYPGVAGGIGGGQSVNNPNVSIGTDYCTGTGTPSSYIEHIFVNMINKDYEGQAGPGIPDNPTIQEFLEEAGAEGHIHTTRVDIDPTNDEETITKHKDYPSENINEAPVVSGDFVFPNPILFHETTLINPSDTPESIEITSIPRYGSIIAYGEVLQIGDSVASDEPVIFIPNTPLIDSSTKDTFTGTVDTNTPLADLNDWGTFETGSSRLITETDLEILMEINSGNFSVFNDPYPSNIGIGLGNTIGNQLNINEVFTFTVRSGSINRIRLFLDGLDSTFEESYLDINDAATKIEINTYRENNSLISTKQMSAYNIIEHEAIYEIDEQEEVHSFTVNSIGDANSSYVVRKIEFSRTLHDTVSYIHETTLKTIKMVHDTDNKTITQNLYETILNDLSGNDNTITHKELTSIVSDNDLLTVDSFISENPDVIIIDNIDGTFNINISNGYTGQAIIKYSVHDGFNTVEARLILNIG